MIQSAERRPRTTHLDLAQRIMDLARERGMAEGAHLPEQAIASAFNVSRTPVRAALGLLTQRGALRHVSGVGYRLAIDPALPSPVISGLPNAAEDELADAILRDRAAQRLDENVTVSALTRRYNHDRSAVLKALRKLEIDRLIDKAPGQSWTFRQPMDAPSARAQSYDLRLLLEPAAIVETGFRLDVARAATLRQEMEALLATPDATFDMRRFEQHDQAFHRMIADGAANRFLGEALGAHLSLRRQPSAAGSPSVYRLKQSTREHLGILDQLEARQFAVAADLMRAHLRLSRNQRPQAASRGVAAVLGAQRRPEGVS